MNTWKSAFFILYKSLYIIEGKYYLFYDCESVIKVEDRAYIPTTHINIVPSGENADIGAEYEQRNMLQPKFKHTFIGS